MMGKKGEKKALTDKKYYEISEFFQNKFGEYAGWAHSYLFTADLAKFKGEVVETKGKSKDKNSNKRKADSLTGETIESLKKVDKQTKKSLKEKR